MRIRGRASGPVIAAAAGALVVGLAIPAGAGAMRHLINGHSIKKHSISGNRLKHHTITASQVKAVKVKAVTLQNGWTNNSPTLTPGYAVDAQGIVHLQGRLSNSAGFQTIAFTLPSALRPKAGLQIPVYEHSGSIGDIVIETTGGVFVDSANGLPNNDPSAAVDLDSVTYIP